MKKSAYIFATLYALAIGLSPLYAQEAGNQRLEIIYVEDSSTFSEIEKDLIYKTIVRSEKETRELLPELPEDIKVILEIMPRNIDIVGGTTGRAQKLDPYGEVYVYISNVYPGGVKAAVNDSNRSFLEGKTHELEVSTGCLAGRVGITLTDPETQQSH